MRQRKHDNILSPKTLKMYEALQLVESLGTFAKHRLNRFPMLDALGDKYRAFEEEVVDRLHGRYRNEKR